MTLQIPTDIHSALVDKLRGTNGATFKIKSFAPTGGGCINETGRLHTSSGDFFLKWNDRSRYPKMFECESSGLQLLKKNTPLRVPDVVYDGMTESHQFLVLENIASGSKSASYSQALGRGLAELHKTSTSYFGLDHNNYIGSLQQFNDRSDSWVSFFIEQRLEKQLTLIREKGVAEPRLEADLQVLYRKLPDLLPGEAPSLLHGDLWSGNVMVDEEGKPCLIDPAVYYGHREADLAMTRLFGGFDPAFYDAYQEVWKLEQGFEERFNIYNLYPLMVHVNLFGGSYLNQVRSTLRRFL